MSSVPCFWFSCTWRCRSHTMDSFLLLVTMNSYMLLVKLSMLLLLFFFFFYFSFSFFSPSSWLYFWAFSPLLVLYWSVQVGRHFTNFHSSSSSSMLFHFPNLVSARFARRVGLARKKYNVPVPETTGDPAFVRTFRAQWVLALVTELRWQSQNLSDTSVTVTELVWYLSDTSILRRQSQYLSDISVTVT